MEAEPAGVGRPSLRYRKASAYTVGVILLCQLLQ